jgi:hypothetical protein
MAQRIPVFPLAVLGTIVLFGFLVWWAVAKSKADLPKIAGPNEPIEGVKPVPIPAGTPQGTKIRAAASPSVEAPPPAKDPGEKILEGADRAFDSGFFETALMFYKDFEVWYAGTETYERNAIRVFERIHTSGAKMAKKDDTLSAYLEARRKAGDDWKRLKPLMAAPPDDRSRAELRKFVDGLPPKDGRRALVDAWLSPGGGEK